MVSRREYLNFDIVIEQSGDIYRASAINSPCGQASVEFNKPFSELELENFVLRMGKSRSGVRRIDSHEMQAVKDLGRHLFTTVFSGEVNSCYLRSIDQVRNQKKGLRLRLRINVPEFNNLPWEFLYDPQFDRFISLSENTPIIRYLELPYTAGPLPVHPPLKIMVMISSPEEYPKLDVQKEWEMLNQALQPLLDRKAVVLERLEHPTLGALQKTLRRDKVHIFHFIGHGKYFEDKQDGMLLLEDEHGRGRPTNGQYLGTILQDHYPLRLVVLNACEGARTSAEDPYAGVAQTLVLQGIPAVIAMQFEILETAAITFAQEFYGAVADGFPVDAAVSEARKALFAGGNEVEWGTPVLYMRTPHGIIFEIPESEHFRVPTEEVPATTEDKKIEDKVEQLYSEGLAAFWAEDWDKALDRFQRILSDDPNNEAAAEKLAETKFHQKLALMYITAVEAQKEKNWSLAIKTLEELLKLMPDYKDSATMLEDIKNQGRLTKLYTEAQQLHRSKNWPLVAKVFEQIHSIDPNYPDPDNLELLAKSELNISENRSELNQLYIQALHEVEAGNWKKAKESLEHVDEIEPDYLETKRLLSKIENEITPPSLSGFTGKIQKIFTALPGKKNRLILRMIIIILGALSVLSVVVFASIQFFGSQTEPAPSPTLASIETKFPASTSTPSNIPTKDDKPIDSVEYKPTVWTDGSILVYVPEGDFIMGQRGKDGMELTVKLDGFWIYRTEVTNVMYENCVASGICTPPFGENVKSVIDANEPVVDVAWEQAKTYCNWLDARLPTEAEWEKTARGPNGNIYPWGDAVPDCNLLNFNNCLGIPSYVTDYPQGRSFYGALDMAGNVFEWVADWYDEDYYANLKLENPTGPPEGEFRSVRGSGYLSVSQDISLTQRTFLSPDDHRSDLGFRCVVNNPDVYSPNCATSPSIPEGSLPSPETGPCSPPYVEIVSNFCFNNTQYFNVDISDDRDGYRIVSYIGDHEIKDLSCSESKDNADDPNESRITCAWFPEETSAFGCKLCPTLDTSEKFECYDGYEYDPQTGLCNNVVWQSINKCPVGFELDGDLGCCRSIQEEYYSPLAQRNCSRSDIPLEYLTCVGKASGKGGGSGLSCVDQYHTEQCLEAGCYCYGNYCACPTP